MSCNVSSTILIVILLFTTKDLALAHMGQKFDSNSSAIQIISVEYLMQKSHNFYQSNNIRYPTVYYTSDIRCKLGQISKVIHNHGVIVSWETPRRMVIRYSYKMSCLWQFHFINRMLDIR